MAQNKNRSTKLSSPESSKNQQQLRKPRIDPYGYEIFKSGLATQPKNPYFVTMVHLKRPNMLFVPVGVAILPYKKLPRKTFIVDAEGRKWDTKLGIWKDGRMVYHGGWKYFCAKNSVTEEDRCVCELIKDMRMGIEIKVHIVRGNGNRGSG